MEQKKQRIKESDKQNHLLKLKPGVKVEYILGKPHSPFYVIEKVHEIYNDAFWIVQENTGERRGIFWWGLMPIEKCKRDII